MPSASTKPEKPASQEVTEPLKILVTVVDKKIRKLEKKKGKIESIQANLDKGVALHEDQKAAVTKYDEVVHSLEFAKELQKQFYQICVEYAKTQRKQAKQELLERQNYQLMRIREILGLQELLNNLGLENVRQDFLLGNNGAVVLNEEELNKLDELYKLISPTREAGDYAENLKSAAEHVLFVLDGRKKNVLEKTTYKDLKELITKIEQCPYFDKSVQETEENGEVIEAIPEEPMEQEIMEQGYVIPSSEIEETQQQHEVPCSLEEATENIEEPQVGGTLHVVNSSASGLDNSYFSSTPYSQPCAVHEALPTVQDNFNFLQESQIDLESPHMDPAVVAAHPMTPSQNISYPPPSQTDSSLQYNQQTFQNQSTSVTTLTTPGSDLQPKPQRSSSITQQVIGPSVNQPLETQTFTNQNYVMATHSLIGSGPSPTQTLPHPNHTSSQPDTTPSAPTPIPLPNQQLLQQQNAAVTAAALSAPKQYPMNVNAAAFQAVGLKQSPHESALSLQQMTNSQLQSQQQQLADLHGGYQHNQSQQTTGFSRSNSNNSNSNTRGSRGSRGGGRSGSSNGYNRGSGRGGYSNGRGSGRFGGNGPLQNIQSRDNYFQGSYQPRDNFSGSTNFNNDYKRGGASQQRGNTRGGIRGNQNRDSGSTRGRGRFNKIQQNSA